jgi:hypothetical protein
VSLNRYAKSRDMNEAEIIDALRKAGASVFVLDRPVDLLVGFRGVNYLVEVKLPLGPQGGSSHSYLTPAQADFQAGWRGQLTVVRTAEEALHEIGLLSDWAPQGPDCTEEDR